MTTLDDRVAALEQQAVKREGPPHPELERLRVRVADLEREQRITIVRIGQMQAAFDEIFAAWLSVESEGDQRVRSEKLLAAWKAAARILGASSRRKVSTRPCARVFEQRRKKGRRICSHGPDEIVARRKALVGHRLPSYSPMAPTLVREPFHRDGWVFEEKVDGWRLVAYKDGDRVRLVSRHGVDHTKRFADVAAAVAKLSACSLVLDGEVAIYDQQLRSRFDSLRQPDPGAVATPPC